MVWLGYTRVSRVGDRSATLISPELQSERIRAYALARGLELEILDPELDVSGGKIERPILSEAIARIEAGQAEGIIVAQLDRLSRAGIVDTHHLIQRIEGGGGKVIAVAESFDDSTPEGRMGRNVMLALGEMQLDRYRAQFAAAKEQAVRRGIWPAPKPPRGYAVGPERRLIPDPDEAAKVVAAFEARAAGKAWAAVADILGSGPSGAAKCIRNRVYLGEINLGEIRNPSAHEPLVSRSLWEAAQIEHPRPARGRHPRGLLAGLVHCASCGYRMTHDTLVKGWRGYRCRPRKAGGTCEAPALISARLLEPFVEAVVLFHAADVEVEADPPKALIEADEALRELEAEFEAFQKAVRVAELGAEQTAVAFRERAAEIESARERVARARMAVPAETLGAVSVGGVWPSLSVDQRNLLLRGALSSIEVRRGRGPVAPRVRLLDPVGEVVEVPDDLCEGWGQA